MDTFFNDDAKPPRNAKVLITVLQIEDEEPNMEKPSLLFRGALKHLSQEQKEKITKNLKTSVTNGKGTFNGSPMRLIPIFLRYIHKESYQIKVMI